MATTRSTAMVVTILFFGQSGADTLIGGFRHLTLSTAATAMIRSTVAMDQTLPYTLDSSDQITAVLVKTNSMAKTVMIRFTATMAMTRWTAA